MKYLIASTFILLVSCSNRERRVFTADIEFTCTPTTYFDTLSTFLLTNNKSDLGGKSTGLERLLNSDRVYKKNITKRNGHFYIDNVENIEYWLLVIECNLDGTLYTGFRRNVDFSDNTLDTLTVKICVEQNMRVISSQ